MSEFRWTLDSFETPDKETLKQKQSLSPIMIATLKANKTPYVLKVTTFMDEKGFHQEKLVEAFQEYMIHKTLQSPYIIQCVGAFIQDGKFYIVLEYANNGTLGDIIKNAGGKHLPEIEIWKYLRLIANGLCVLRKDGIIHRDLKPANLFVDANHRLRIADFGNSAKKSAAALHLLEDGGTDQFRSPELENGYPYSFPTDIYSFGIIMFYLATLKMPEGRFFQRPYKPAAEQFRKFTTPAGASESIYSEELCNIISEMLEYDPLKRPTAEKIAKAAAAHARSLKDAAGGSRSPSPPPPEFIPQQPFNVKTTVLQNFDAAPDTCELSVLQGEVVYLLEESNHEWCLCRTLAGVRGYLPSSILSSEREMEAPGSDDDDDDDNEFAPRSLSPRP